MTPSELKQLYLEKRPEGLFFSRANMKHAGDTMANYGVMLFECDGIEYAELYRKKKTSKGAFNSCWFKMEDLSHSTIDPDSRRRWFAGQYFHNIPFDNRWHQFDSEGYVEYTATLYDKGRNLTLAEYKAEHPDQEFSEPMLWKEAEKVIDAYEQSKYLDAPAHDITLDEWDDALNVLPPMKWRTVNGVESFMMSERLTGDITSCYARSGNTYKSFNVRTSYTGEQIAEKFNEKT